MESVGLAVVLAAGEGTRMRSRLPKVLHAIGNRPMIGHVLAASALAGIDRTALVVGRGGAAVAEAARAEAAPSGAPTSTLELDVFEQTERRGTAHAVLAARGAIAATPPTGAVVVLFGDTPLVTARTIRAVAAGVSNETAVAVLGFRPDDPTGYGRLLMDGDRLVAIREERDASPAEREIGLCNSGIMALSAAHALDLLDAVGNDNAKKEFYLTDVVSIARAKGLRTAVSLAPDPNEVTGVNDRAQLAAAEAIFQDRARRHAMAGGATLTAPETVFFSADTVLGSDVVVEPNVVFGPGVSVADGALIRAFSHLEGAHVATGATVGPYARLRPTTRIGEKARVGNFVEVKNATLETGAKVNHLSYVGDARVGAAANVGAGTITCNYDGRSKFVTDIGAGAFIGSNSALVAPVRIGDRAFVASGSVVVDDVPDEALTIARGRQVVKPGRSKVRPDGEG